MLREDSLVNLSPDMYRSRYANGTVPNPLPGLRSARSRLRRIKWSGA